MNAACPGTVDQLLYYPMKYPAGEWSVQQSLGAKDITVRAADGTRLHAWWIQTHTESSRFSAISHTASARQRREHYASWIVSADHCFGRIIGIAPGLSRLRKERRGAV